MHDNLPADHRSTVNILQPGHRYDFRMRAIALEGLNEDYPSRPENRVAILTDCMRDMLEPAVVGSQSAPIKIGETQLHTFCPAGDKDSIHVIAASTKPIYLEIDPINNQLPIKVTVLSPDAGEPRELTVEEESQIIEILPLESQLGQWTFIISPYDPLVAGDDTTYQITYLENVPIKHEGVLIAILLGFFILALPIIFFVHKRKRNH